MVLAAGALVHAQSPKTSPADKKPTGAAPIETKTGDNKAKSPPIQILYGEKGLPAPVSEMRDAILAAARTGKLSELLIPIQWNELPPDFGDMPATSSKRDPVPYFKSLSIDGEGREIMAILIKVLSAPAAVVREGRDIENNRTFIWPYLARLPLKTLTPAQSVELLGLVPRADYVAMVAGGTYTSWSVTIGADGTWHSFHRKKSGSNQ
ncbi:MAG TPA: hypothetical protein VMX97_04820 [Hyphomicrobiaceae bacterium]|nr:hypothetical protein [Hyphomicrobiaceae bacterium]